MWSFLPNKVKVFMSKLSGSLVNIKLRIKKGQSNFKSVRL